LLSGFDPIAVESLSGRLKVPATARDLALLAARHAHSIAVAHELDAPALLALFDAADAWRRPGRFMDLAAAVLAVERDAAPARARLLHAQQAAAAVDAGSIAREAGSKDEIRRLVNAARLAAIEVAVHNPPEPQ
jgi:tRNA nucleotidyltransferase (CCA-adding enzyme)